MNWKFWQKKKRRRRGFDAVSTSRLYTQWLTTSKSIDEDIKGGLTTLRARSRDLCQNNDYGRRFLALLASNVVGANGIMLQAKAQTQKGSKWVPDTTANEKIEAAWKAWGSRGQCTVDRTLTFVDCQRLAIQAAARDGELFNIKATGFDNEFGFALQIKDPDYIDHTYTDEMASIRMGVERNTWGQPIAYYLLTKHPGDSAIMSPMQKYTRLTADQVIHGFLSDRPEQTRGYPWTVTALKRLYMLGHYEESELVASRISASKMGFFVSPDGVPPIGDDTDTSGNTITEASPGQFGTLPIGYDFKEFDPNHPGDIFDEFVKAVLRGAAAGLGVAYSSLSNNLSDVNFSSLRHGTLEERAIWMQLQNWLIAHYCQPIFDAWLPMAIASGQLALPMSKLDQWRRISWQPKRWPWVDPLKDIQAHVLEVEYGLNSRTVIASEGGRDIDDIFKQLATENQKAKDNQISIVKQSKEETNAKEDQNRRDVSGLQLHQGRH